MDRKQEELQYLGFLDIFKESFKTIFSKKKIFSQITLAFIFPLSIIFLAHYLVFQVLLFDVLSRIDDLALFPNDDLNHVRISYLVSTQLILFWLSNAIFFILLLLLSLLSSSTLVYTIASIFTTKEITLKKAMSVVPKVWKRLILTFFLGFAIIFVYNILAGLVMHTILAYADYWSPKKFLMKLISSLLIYFIGFVCIGSIWFLSIVVSVLENSSGIQAMTRSKNLIKGKMGVAFGFSIVLSFCFWVLLVLFQISLAGGLVTMILAGILLLLLLSIVVLIGLVVQTVLYFVCKSYHLENIDHQLLVSCE